MKPAVWWEIVVTIIFYLIVFRVKSGFIEMSPKCVMIMVMVIVFLSVHLYISMIFVCWHIISNAVNIKRHRCEGESEDYKTEWKWKKTVENHRVFYSLCKQMNDIKIDIKVFRLFINICHKSFQILVIKHINFLIFFRFSTIIALSCGCCDITC